MHEPSVVREAAEGIAEDGGTFAGLHDTEVDLPVIEAFVVLPMGRRGSHEDCPGNTARGRVAVEVRG